MNAKPSKSDSASKSKTQAKSPAPFLPKRVGKIANLSPDVLEELNQRLDEGEQGQPLLDWLNGLKETKELLRENFDGKPINKQNLSDWRRGGYAEWSMRCDLLEQAAELTEQADNLKEDNGEFLVDNFLQIFIARYAAFFLRWDGRITPETDQRIRLFTRMRRDIEHLQKAAHGSARQQREWDQLEKEDYQAKLREATDRALAPLQQARNRNLLIQAYGPEAGAAFADVYDKIAATPYIDPYGEPGTDVRPASAPKPVPDHPATPPASRPAKDRQARVKAASSPIKTHSTPSPSTTSTPPPTPPSTPVKPTPADDKITPSPNA